MQEQINTLKLLYDQLVIHVSETFVDYDITEARSNINSQLSLLTLLFQQLIFETDTICDIIMAAEGEIIHSSIISVTDLRKQLKDISLNLPREQKLPFDLNYISHYELSKMSRLNIVYSNEMLIFVTIIPLINPIELTLYYVIPLPVRKNDHFMYIVPELN
jgi:hypothetical protein